MRAAAHCFILQTFALLILCIHESMCSSYRVASSKILVSNHETLLSPDTSPSMDPQPFLPLIAPSPLMPFVNNGMPTLSGLCALNFSAYEILLNTTATDCWNTFAPYVSNAICCPQLIATVTILIGQSSKYSRELSLNVTQAENCLSDIEKILQSRGAIENVRNVCSISPLNLTQGSCPVINYNKIEQIVDSSNLIDACGKIDDVNECCTQICQKEISNAAIEIVSKGHTQRSHLMSKQLTFVEDCESIIVRWLASKIDPISMNRVLRGISGCSINKVCPLVLPNTLNITKNCGNTIANETTCCNAMETYVSQLQEQSLITNSQAMTCVELLGTMLQKANVTRNVYNICRIKLKDFSLQVMEETGSSQGSGCLLPSLPSDATYDNTFGISFACDLNDNVAAPWPSTSFSSPSSCSKSPMLPSLPKATSAENGGVVPSFMYTLFVAVSLLV